MIVPPWVRLLAAAAVVCGSFGAGWYVNGQRHENKALRADAGRQEALAAAVEKERVRADQYSQQVIELLQATPPVTNTIRETIRENPSKCVRPAPVTDSLQSALGRANQALAASRGDGRVPRPADETPSAD